MAINNETTKKSYCGANLNIRKETTPAMPPKINPFKESKPEVFGSISITKTKNQLIS